MKRKSLAFTLMLILFVLFGAVSPVYAQGIVAGDTIPAGTTVDDDVVLFGETVTIDGDVNGNVFALGGVVTVNGKVDGSLYAISQQVKVNGEVTDGVYGTALELLFGPEGRTGRNVAFLGLSVAMPEGSSIGRDLTGIFILGAQFAGNVERETTAVIGPLEVVRLVIRMLNIEAPPFLAPQTSHPGGMKLAAPAAIDPQAQGVIDTFLLQKRLISMAREYVSLLLIGLLALWLIPGHLKRWGEKVRQAPFSSLGIGLAAVVVGIVGLALLWVLILAVALGLGSIGFSGLGTAFGMLGFFTASTAGALLFVIVVFLSKLILAFLAGSLILKRFERQSFWYRLGVLALGLLIYVLLAEIPYIGWAFAMIVMLLGTGAVFMVYNDERKFEKSLAAGASSGSPDVASTAAAVAPMTEPLAAAPAPVVLQEDERPVEPVPSEETPAPEKPVKAKSTKKSSN